jgi:hypothetical protein
MVDGSRLELARHGVFRLHANHEHRSVSSFQFIEARIRRALCEAGGIAKREDIDSALWMRERGSKERPYDYTLVTRVLRESPCFRQDFGFGYWNLGEEERSDLPLPGYWASAELDRLNTDNDEFIRQRADFFEKVGCAFSEARHAVGLEIDNVADDPAVRDALHKLASAGRGLRAEALAEANAMAKGANRYGMGVAVFKTQSNLDVALYAMFEFGNLLAHIFADASFYRACGTLFRVCPAKLSRGIVEQKDTVI